MKISYNSPIILTFSILCTIIYTFKHFVLDGINNFFSVPGTIDQLNFAGVMGVFTHVLGHASWEHLLSNLSLILILGPILEEKYGSSKLIIMILITAFMTGVLNIILFDTGLLGASGIVFMMILLSSLTNFKSGEIPLTFVLVLAFYLGREIISAFNTDTISQFGHIFGGICGAIFGFWSNGSSASNSNEKPKKDSVRKELLSY